MPGPDLPEIPAPLKILQHYLKIASEHDQRDPVVSYWSRLYALQTGLKLSTKTTAENNFLLKLMDWLETTKKTLIDNEAITNEVAAQAHLENWALKLFLYADKNDRESNFNKSVIQSFYTAGLLYDVLTTFGELTEEAVQNRKYAKWKASYIHNCLKNGETPVPGPMKEDDEDDDMANVNFSPEEDLLADVAADSAPADPNDGEDENQADASTPNEPDVGLDEAEKAPSEPEIDSAEEAPEKLDPEIDSAEEAPLEPEVDEALEVRTEPEEDAAEEIPEIPDGEDENQADVATPTEPETPDPESAKEDPSESGIDGAEEPADAEDENQADEATSNEPETTAPESAEEPPSESGTDGASADGDTEAPGMQQPTPPPNTDAFGFPSVPSGSNTGIGSSSSQVPGNTPYPTLPSSITPNPYNPAPTPTSPSVPQDFAATPKPTGGVTLNAEQMIKAQKYIKWAGSAINYDDVPTAIGNLQKALHLLTTGDDS